MNTTTDPILDLIPAGYKGFALALIILAPILGRAYKALQNNGGLKGVWNAILFGTNVPTKGSQLDIDTMSKPQPPTVRLPLLAGLLVCGLLLPACGTLPDGTRTFAGMTGAQGWDIGKGLLIREAPIVYGEVRQARELTSAKNPQIVEP